VSCAPGGESAAYDWLEPLYGTEPSQLRPDRLVVCHVLFLVHTKFTAAARAPKAAPLILRHLLLVLVLVLVNYDVC